MGILKSILRTISVVSTIFVAFRKSEVALVLLFISVCAQIVIMLLEKKKR